MILWNVGTNEPAGPDRMVEVVTPAVLGGRQVWRVTHYDQDPTSTRQRIELDQLTQSLDAVKKTSSILTGDQNAIRRYL
jgi:hypothetical protein